MDEDFLELEGDRIAPSELRIAKACSLAEALSQDQIDYARLVECVRVGESEIVIFDADIEVPQLAVYPIEEIERIAVVFDVSDSAHPGVLAMRVDFPMVPHLYIGEEEIPRSLCLYEESYEELKLRWTPHRYVARIREWLSLNAQGMLHQEGQPLEPFLANSSGYVVIPDELFSSEGGTLLNTLYMYARNITPGNYFFVAVNEKPRPGERALAVTASIHYCQPRTSSIIRQKPRTFSQLVDFASEGGIELVCEIRERLLSWKKETPKGDDVFKSNLIIILILPKVRREGDAIPEAVEIRVFYCFDNVKTIGEKLGLWSEIGGMVGALIGDIPEKKGEDINIDVLNALPRFSRKRAAAVNGYGTPVDTKITAIGIGALGSPLVTNLFRSGFGQWTLIDFDLLLPHNVARHSLTSGHVGLNKTVGMAEFLTSIMDEGFVKEIAANVMAPGKYEAEVREALENSDIVVEMSASVSVARLLSLDTNSKARRVSLFMNPTGEDLILLAEDKNRKNRLDEIEMQYYRAIAQVEDLSGHFKAADNRRRYGQSCRDLTSVIPQDYFILYSAIGARALREVESSANAKIIVWRSDPVGNVKRIDVDVCETIELEIKDWKVCTDRCFWEKVVGQRSGKLPNETGGILLGHFDLHRKIIYLVDTLPCPSDSRGGPRVFYRGHKGLKAEVESISIKTDGMLEYIGEWHSHPDHVPPEASSDDLKVFAWLQEVMAKEGLPPVMMIISENEARIYVGEKDKEFRLE
jgi:integrative and conjugative element protein (TIGR02256 family)